MRGRWIVPLLLLAVIAGYWWLRQRRQNWPEAYVGERSVTLWSTLAQVKQPVDTLHYGEKVAVLQRKGAQVQVRTPRGVSGWLEARLLMEPALWQRSAQLLAQARVMTVQARGHTKVISNVRIEPGRAASRLFQFGRNSPLDILSRAAAESSTSTEESPIAARESPEEEHKARREDWFLVHGFGSSGAGSGEIESVAGKSEVSSAAGTPGKSVEVAGWVLARFVELDLPDPLREYASAAGMRAVAWFELNRVADESGEKPQYLVAGARGGEGQPCDFTMIRVYTWGARRQRYETAYIESDVCGRLPIRATQSAAGPEFRFAALTSSDVTSKSGETANPGYEERLYRMRQTIVRRVRSSERAAVRRRPPPQR